ncbi:MULTISPECIES: hypothetical protein [unclassified Curtobacterium]|uniref:hypothetical protein n=1 Tax=unclassified Curtobacterium TaxID=257496 RepID=UPI0021A3B513|nr:hypothetical protein [Curtobacterium sp. PhB131]
MVRDRGDRDVVRLPTQWDRVRGIERLRSGRREGQHLDVDPLRVHRSEPGVTEVTEQRTVVAEFVQRRARVAAVVGQGVDGVRQSGVVPVLFDRDQGHRGSSVSSCTDAFAHRR